MKTHIDLTGIDKKFNLKSYFWQASGVVTIRFEFKSGYVDWLDILHDLQKLDSRIRDGRSYVGAHTFELDLN